MLAREIGPGQTSPDFHQCWGGADWGGVDWGIVDLETGFVPEVAAGCSTALGGRSMRVTPDLGAAELD